MAADSSADQNGTIKLPLSPAVVEELGEAAAWLSPLIQASAVPIMDVADELDLSAGLQVHNTGFKLGICNVLMFGLAVVVGRPSSSLLDEASLVLFPDTVDNGALWDDALSHRV